MTLLRVPSPKFTHEELMALAVAMTQYHDNRDEEDGLSEEVESALAKLTSYQAGLPQPVMVEDVLKSPMLVAGPHTAGSFHDAVPFAVFVGQPDPSFDPGTLVWSVFDIEFGTVGDLEEASRKTGLPVTSFEPEVDQEAREANEGRDDLDAALAYLKAGGVLCKVPDAANSRHYHMMSVNVIGSPDSGNVS